MSDGVTERDEGCTFGGFVLRRQLGSDAWGDRWLVEREDGDGTEFAMLVAREGDPEACERLLEGLSEVRSAYAGSTLRHPGILRLEEAGVLDDVPFLVYESFPGCGLDALTDAWRERGEVDDDHDQRVAELFVEIGAALQHGHELGIAHGDLRPSNLLVDGTRVRVHGYGLAAVADDIRSLRSARTSVTAPELVDDPDRPVDELADLYSLGVLMYEALTLQVPYEGINREALRKAILKGDAPAPCHVQPWISKSLSRIVAQAMARRPEDRYASIEAFVADLYRFIDGEPVHARGPSSVEEALTWARDNPRICRGVAAGVLAVTLGSVLFTGDDDAPVVSAAVAPVRAEESEVLWHEELPPVDGIEEGVQRISPGLEVAPAPEPVVEDEPEEDAAPVAEVEEDEPAVTVLDPAATDPVASAPLVAVPVIEPTAITTDTPEQEDDAPATAGPLVLEPEAVAVPDPDAPWSGEIVEAEVVRGEQDDEDAPAEELAVDAEADVAVAEPTDGDDGPLAWDGAIVDADELDATAPAELATDDVTDPLVADADVAATQPSTELPTDAATPELDVAESDAPIAEVTPEPDQPADALVAEPIEVEVATADDVPDEPEVPEAPPRPLTRAEWMQRLADAADALRRAHTDVDVFAEEVVVETVFTPERAIPADALWAFFDDATIADRMPQLRASAREAVQRLAKGLTISARASRVAHSDWEAAFEAFVVVGAIPPSPITNADLPSVDVAAAWLEARTALAVLDGAYVPDMWIIPDLYLRVGRGEDAAVLCEHLLATGLPAEGQAFAHARLTWAATRLAPGASSGGALDAWRIVHDALDASDPSLVARAAHLLGERALRRGDMAMARTLFQRVVESAGSSATLWSWAAEADRWVRALTPPSSETAALALDDPFDDVTERLLRAIGWHASGCDEAARTVFERISREGFASDEAVRAAERLRCASLLAVRRPVDARFAVDELTDHGSAVLSPDVVFVMARAGVALHRGGHHADDLLAPVLDRVTQWYGEASDDARFVRLLLDGIDPFAPLVEPAAPLVEASVEDTPVPSVFDVFAANVEPTVAAKEREPQPEPEVVPPALVIPDLPPELQPVPDYVPPESDLRYPLRNRDG